MGFDYNQVIKVFKKGIDNQGYVYNVVSAKRSLLFEIKKSCLLILYVFLSKKKEVPALETIKIVNGNHQLKILAEVDAPQVFLGASLVKISKETLNNSVFSCLKRSGRLSLLFKSLKLVVQTNAGATFSESIEFVGLSMLFETLTPKTVVVAGHCDRYATWIAYLAEIYGFELAIRQHGCVAKESLPHKVPCSALWGFNHEEILFFEKYIIEKRTGYEAHIKKLNSTVNFIDFDNLNHDRLIAFATGLDLKENSVELVKRIREQNFSGKIFFYIHPSANEENFAKLKEYDVVLCPIERHRNIDILMTHFSSLVYDYLSIGFKGEIVCFQDEQTINRVPAMFSNPDIHVYDSIDKILAHVV